MIRDNPWQPRQAMQEEVIADLAENIAQLGLLQPPMGRRTVGGAVELAFGHQRVAAIRHLVADGRWPGGVPVQLREISDEQVALVALTENQKRKDLNPIEEFRAYRRAIDTIPGLTISELARKLNIDRSTLSNNLRLLKLPDAVLDKCAVGVMPLHSARECLCLVNDDQDHAAELAAVMDSLSERNGNDAWSITNVRAAINRLLEISTKNWQPLEISAGHSNYGHTMPAFDAVAFAKEFPGQIHKVPMAYSQGHMVWTCNGKEWHKHQKEALAAQNNGKKADGHLAALAADPVLRDLAGVSLETLTSVDDFGPAERAMLGTRLEWVEDTYTHQRNGGFCHALDPKHYDPPPPYFDGDECKTCVKGAAYAKFGVVTMPACLNQECYGSKVEAGKQAHLRQLAERVAEEDLGDAKMVDSLLHGAGLGEFVAYHVGRQLLRLLQGCYPYSGAPADAPQWKWGAAFDYHPATVKRVAELLGLPEPQVKDGKPAIDCEKAVKAFEQAPRQVWREVAANLIAYAERRRLKDGHMPT